MGMKNKTSVVETKKASDGSGKRKEGGQRSEGEGRRSEEILSNPSPPAREHNNNTFTPFNIIWPS
jgi:hypothetical protein